MDEYINRKAALESLCAGCEYVPIEEKEVCPYRFTGCQEYANIFAIPAADVVPVRHGRWISEPGHIPNCSGCGRYSDDADTGEAICCPFCGALMDKDGDA